MDVATACILTIFSLINIIMHLIGCTMLISIYRKAIRKIVQQFYLINVSLIIVLKNVFALLLVVLELTEQTNRQTQALSNAIHVLGFLFGTTTLCYYCFMFYLTVDRLAGTMLNFRYPVLWNIRKARFLIVMTISICFIIFTSLVFLHFQFGHEIFIKYHIYDIFYTYIPSCLDVGFIVLAITTYVVIFMTYTKSSRRSTGRKKSSVAKQDDDYFKIYNLFFNSRFLISIFIIASFLLFSVIPGLTYACFQIIGTRIPDSLLICIYISFKVSDAAESIIYIFLQASVRKLFFKKFNLRRIIDRYSSRSRKRLTEESFDLERMHTFN